MKQDPKVEKALAFAKRWSQNDGEHHKTWAIDQMVRILTGCWVDESGCVPENGTSGEYEKFIAEFQNGEDGPESYEWEVGIPP